MSSKEAEREEIERKKKLILLTALTPRARERLSNLRLVRPELVEQVENQIIYLISQGRIRPPIDDEIVKKILIEIQRHMKRDYRIIY